MKIQQIWITAALLFATSVTKSIEPADRKLIPEARPVLSYLASIYGKKTLPSGLIGEVRLVAANQFPQKESK